MIFGIAMAAKGTYLFFLPYVWTLNAPYVCGGQ